jgi:hypothetical protein
MSLSWILFLFGIWIIISAALSGLGQWYNVVNFVIGILIALFSFWQTKRRGGD